MKKISKLLLIITSTLSLCACNNTNNSSSEVEQTPEVVNFAVLNGATGFGASKLMEDAKNKTSKLNYSCSVETSPDVVKNSLIAKTIDIACLPTNNAAMIYNTDESLIEVVAVNTLSVLYAITTKDVTPITSLSELEGKTISIPSAPSYILNAILDANNIKATLDLYPTPSDLLKKVATNQVSYAVLPEPLLSAAKVQNADINISFDLNDKWNEKFSSPIMQGCVVIRKEFINMYPSSVEAFLEEYEASINYVKANKDEASTIIESYFGTKAPIAKQAIARSGLTFIKGKEMKEKLDSYYTIIKDIENSNIKGKVPSEGFYYNAK